MGKITLILGGARSGKSSHALQIAQASGKSVTFLATAQACDDEMSARIDKHKSERPAHWHTLEVPLDLAPRLANIHTDVVILDCVTLLVSNLLMQYVKDDAVEEEPFLQASRSEIDSLIAGIRASNQHWIIVSNEVGLGLVPPYQLGRVYRDGLGWANQRLAKDADEVLFLVAGIPMNVK
jgi:adenosylcobinamide kinase/adenosylcobinamide-phosphate guanylyltransferase